MHLSCTHFHQSLVYPGFILNKYVKGDLFWERLFSVQGHWEFCQGEGPLGQCFHLATEEKHWHQTYVSYWKSFTPKAGANTLSAVPEVEL